MSSPRLFYAEWSLEEGADPTDVDGWYQANPAMGIRISEEFVRSELDAMRDMPEEFARERLGVPELLASETSVIDLAVWQALADEHSKIATHRCIALDVSPDRKWSTFGAAGRRADGKLHVEAFDRRPGTGWVVARGVELHGTWKLPIRIQKGAPAASFVLPLRAEGVEVLEVSTDEHAQAAGQFLDAAANDGLRHLGKTALDAAIAGADLRASGDAQLWGRRSSKVDITPLVAVSIALGGVPAQVEPWAPLVAYL